MAGKPLKMGENVCKQHFRISAADPFVCMKNTDQHSAHIRLLCRFSIIELTVIGITLNNSNQFTEIGFNWIGFYIFSILQVDHFPLEDPNSQFRMETHYHQPDQIQQQQQDQRLDMSSTSTDSSKNKSWNLTKIVSNASDFFQTNRLSLLPCCDTASTSSLGDSDDTYSCSNVSLDSLVRDWSDASSSCSDEAEKFDGRWPVQKPSRTSALSSMYSRSKSYSLEDLRNWDN
jgi:hypothetical protein